jgi:hypothetical protein
MLHLHVLGGRRMMELCHKGLRYQDHADKRRCGVDLFAETSNQRRAPPVYMITSSKAVDLLYRNNVQPVGAASGTVDSHSRYFPSSKGVHRRRNFLIFLLARS